MNRLIKQIVYLYLRENRKRKKLNEVGCFRSLHTALRKKPGIVVKEYHAKSYVKFSIQDTNFKKIKKYGKCELSDLVIISFSSKKQHPVKITFLQAKITKNSISHAKRYKHKYSVDHTQWDLLHNRPSVKPTGQIKNKVPSTILSNAVYPSIGSYGFFIPESNGKDAGFSFFSSAILRPVKAICGKAGQVTVQMGKNRKTNPDETNYCCCLSIFLENLFLGRIGSPIRTQAENELVGGLIKSILDENVSTEEETILNSLREQLDLDQKEIQKINMRFVVIDTSKIRTEA
ncbi:hypothetical protein [Peredibacter starrii]|uniref:Uncharacterized protein n=1 Tax=Peredibacter starrii TaxID=28202 RepID=A0AAX4HU52_9BACT|nr:hypothetical protein [Peredibacter starrii]WPU66511.1 hypothetical protein SOO65_07110 [Peredibacter starrii]